MAAYCYVIGGDHDFSDPSQPVLAQARRSAGVTIGAGAWLGAGAKILDGVTIGDRAIIGAGAVVREAGARPARSPSASRRSDRRARATRAAPAASEAERAAGLRSPRLGRIADARRQAAVRVDDSAVRSRSRYNVSLVSLRKKDLSEETLESFGVDITYLHKSKFDPATLPALLKVIDRKKIDILHLHGYGATTFGRHGRRRCAGCRRSCTSTRTSPTRRGSRRSPTASLEPVTDIAHRGLAEHGGLRDQRAPDSGRTR